MYDSSLLNWRQRNLAFNSGKAFIMQAFGKSFPSSLPFSVNGEQKRQNSQMQPQLLAERLERADLSAAFQPKLLNNEMRQHSDTHFSPR